MLNLDLYSGGNEWTTLQLQKQEQMSICDVCYINIFIYIYIYVISIYIKEVCTSFGKPDFGTAHLSTLIFLVK